MTEKGWHPPAAGQARDSGQKTQPPARPRPLARARSSHVRHVPALLLVPALVLASRSPLRNACHPDARQTGLSSGDEAAQPSTGLPASSPAVSGGGHSRCHLPPGTSRVGGASPTLELKRQAPEANPRPLGSVSGVCPWGLGALRPLRLQSSPTSCVSHNQQAFAPHGSGGWKVQD